MKTGSFIGIDFGTFSTSVVSVTRDGQSEKMSVLGEEGEFPFASLMAISEENKVFFGNKVRKSREALSESCRLVSPLKSLLGTGKTISINGKECSARQLTSEYFRCLKRVIQKRYSIDVKEAALSFPADLSPEARRDLAEAARKAEIKITGFISEPTAAFLSVYETVRDKGRVMICDWGGERLDISILSSENGRIREEAVRSEETGGGDIDRALAEKIHAEFGKTLDDKSKAAAFSEMPPAERDKLFAAAERAKIQLSADGRDFPLTVHDYGVYGTKTITVTNDMLSEIVRPTVEDRVMGAVDKTLAEAGISDGEISAVIAAGGSGNLRAFTDALQARFGKEKLIIPEKPQFISAKGAAASAFAEGGFRLTDDMGIIMSDGTMFPLLKKDSDGVGSKSAEYTFSAVEDTNEAHVIVASEGSRRIRERISVPIKGFLGEKIKITAGIDETQTARIRIITENSAEDKKEKIYSVNGLTFYYDTALNG